jgi:hypothetical protein
MLRLADYQIRLLLCRPDRKEAVDEYRAMRLHWNCGCAAMEDARGKYLVDACPYHGALLQQITEGDERHYDGVRGEDLLLPPTL